MKHITLVRTHYSHWASRSGYCLLSEYLQKRKTFTVKEIVTRKDSGDQDHDRKETWQGCGMPWYAPEDQVSECVVHEAWLARKSELVHFFDGEKGYYYSQTLSREKKTRIVATYHQPPSVMERYGLLGDKRQLEHLDRLVILSESQRAFFEDYVASDRIVCIPHGVDTAFYRPAQERAQRRRKLRCLSVGFWLRDLVVMDRVIRAFRDRKDVVFQIVGLQAGAENEAVDRTIYASLKKCPNVRLYENIEDGKLLELYQSADVLFLPLTDCTANNVLLEALSCGLPILTTDHSGTRYYLDNDGACFARPGDVKDTVERLRAIVSQDEMRKTLSERGRQRAEERYGWEKIALRYHELYKEILNKPRKPRRRDRTLKKAMCTVVSSDFLQQALALYLSATKHGDCDFFILVADDHHDAERFREVQQRVNGRLTLLRRRDLQRNLAFHYDEDSLRWALKPSLMLHLLETLRYDAVMFADNDVCFFESYDFLFKELERSAVLLTPHWRPINPEENLAQFTCNFSHGLYNAGFIGASRKGVEALRWWEHVCKVRCEKREGEGFYVDQRYLDALPVYFDGVRVLDHKGCNVAEWNAEHLPRVAVGGKSFVEIWPIVFIHFTGLTIKRIDENRDPALEAYLETYRKLLNEAERLMAQEELDLLEAMDRSPCEADVTEEKPEASPTASIDLCVAVDFMNIPNFLLQLESIRTSFRVMPTVWALCADYESYDFLKRLKDRVELVVWRELKSYRLEKLRKRYENCQTGFTLGATPFFLRHLLTDRMVERALLLDSHLLFVGKPDGFLSALVESGGSITLPHWENGDGVPRIEGGPSGLRDYRMVLLNRESTDFLRVWTREVLRTPGGDSKRQRSAGLQPSSGKDLRDCGGTRECVVFPEDSERCATKGPMNSLRSCILMYDDGALTIRDWTLRISERSTHHAVIDTYNKFITDLFGKVKTRYGLSKANDLDIQLRSCSTDDLIRILYLHRSYITHFGLLVHEDSEGTPSDVMKAYLLYLLAVRSRDQGKTDDAFRIFHLLAETKALLPDLYRGKTHYHMGEMAEEKGDFRRAFEHYTACLERMPYHADARERADLLKGHLQITERATRTMDDRPADTRQVVL